MNDMTIPMWLMNMGGISLGLTLAVIILALLAGRRGISGIETCLISVICLIGFSISVLFYTAAALV